MPPELAYVIITPYSLHKSRTGGILARLISRTSLELEAARMFAPGPDLVQEYSKVIVSTNDPQDRRIQELIRDYILQNLSPDSKTKRRRRAMMLVFKGEDAVRKVRDVLGPTDPAKAPPGSIRKEFGQTIMINAAHASDSVENAKREMAIVRVDENNFKPLIENFYRRQ